MLPALFELAGIVCLTVAGAIVHPALAFLIAGIGLIGKGFEAERKARPATSDRRPNMARERS